MDAIEINTMPSITEGKASIIESVISENTVFYNKAQIFNRNISILAIKAYYALYHRINEKNSNGENLEENNQEKKFVLLEPLAASGLRSIRYCLELNDIIDYVIASDCDKNSVRTMIDNRNLNRIDSSKLKIIHIDANKLMNLIYCHGLNILDVLEESNESHEIKMKRFNYADFLIGKEKPYQKSVDVIDIDPYGTLISFLDSAVKLVKNNGLLCLTSTDTRILCGNYPEVCFYRYGGTTFKSPYMHEMSLRILLYAVIMTASKYKLCVIPLMSISVDYYTRCFVMIKTSPISCKSVASSSGVVYQCTACDYFKIMQFGQMKKKANAISYRPYKISGTEYLRECPECNGSDFIVGGPMYTGPLHTKEFVDECLQIYPTMEMYSNDLDKKIWDKILQTLKAIQQENSHIVLYYAFNQLLMRTKVNGIQFKYFCSALLNLGYEVSHFHRDCESIKTNAKLTILYDILRKWSQSNQDSSSQPNNLVSKEITTNGISFEVFEGISKLPLNTIKWNKNPCKYWGPKKRARTTSDNDYTNVEK